MARRRKPNTWKYMKAHRGPDTSHWAGPAFTLKDRAKAANHPSDYLDLFSRFGSTQTLNDRNQRPRKFVVKHLEVGADFRLSLFMGGDMYIFVHEVVVDNERHIKASITYESLGRALERYERNRIIYKEFSTLPKSDAVLE